MLETHGQNWHREVHLPTWWICPLCNTQDTTYSKAQDLSEHISKLHGDILTGQQIQIIVHQSRLRAPRSQDVCPLCCLSIKDEQDTDKEHPVLKKAFPNLSAQSEELGESHKRIKTETGSIQPNQHEDSNSKPAEQVAPNPQTPVYPSQQLLNVETIGRHVAAHLQGIMLLTLRMMVLDAVQDMSKEDKGLSGGTDDGLSRFSSNQQHSRQEIQGIDAVDALLVQDDNMDLDDLLLEDTIPDCEHDIDWQDVIGNSAISPETDRFLQQMIDSGAFRTKERVPTRAAPINDYDAFKKLTGRSNIWTSRARY